MKKRHNKRNIRKKTTAAISLAMILTSQVSPFVQIIRASPHPEPKENLHSISNNKVELKMDHSNNYIVSHNNSDNDNIIKVSTESGNSLSLEPLKKGSPFFNLIVSNIDNTFVQSFIVNNLNTGNDGILDIGDIVNFLNLSPSSAVASDVKNMLMGINSRAFSNPSNPDSNLAPLIVSSPVLTFDPNENRFYPNVWNIADFFQDPNQDSLSYAIVQQPDDLSGLSLSLNWGQELAFGGVPTLPTSFTVRATDPGGLYADLTSTLQFVPEPVSHTVVDATGTRTQVDLNTFFRDRDNDPLTFELSGTSYAANAFIEGGLLTYSGTILAPVRMGVTATDPQGWSAYNVIEIQGENLAPLTVSSPVLTFDPNENRFYPSFWNISNFFQDPNQDSLSYAIVQQPDDLSGLSLSLNWGQELAFGGVPTLPTSFTVRATDPGGLYADLTSTLQFVPEPVSHTVVDATGTRTQVDLNAFFRDRDNDPLTFELSGTSYAANAFIEGGLLTYSGTILAPVRMGVTATDPQGWSAYNVIDIQGENLAPLTVSSPVLTFDPNENRFYPNVWNIADFFQDPNQDSLSYAIVQQPDDLSGLSLSLNWGQELAFGGVPTLPTSFTVRATDPGGLYADLTSTLQFVPEPVSHTVVDATGTRTQVDLNAFFRDRDNDPLTFVIDSIISSGSISAWVDGNLLSVSGIINSSVRLNIRATDSHHSKVNNTVHIELKSN